MNIKFNDKDIELTFGLKALSQIDKELGFEIEGASLGQGLEVLVPKLDSGDLIAIATLVKAASKGIKQAPQSDEDVEQVLDNIAQNEGYEAFGKKAIEKLGERPMTAALVPEEMKKAVKKQKA